MLEEWKTPQGFHYIGTKDWPSWWRRSCLAVFISRLFALRSRVNSFNCPKQKKPTVVQNSSHKKPLPEHSSNDAQHAVYRQPLRPPCRNLIFLPCWRATNSTWLRQHHNSRHHHRSELGPSHHLGRYGLLYYSRTNHRSARPHNCQRNFQHCCYLLWAGDDKHHPLQYSAITGSWVGFPSSLL